MSSREPGKLEVLGESVLVAHAVVVMITPVIASVQPLCSISDHIYKNLIIFSSA